MKDYTECPDCDGTLRYQNYVVRMNSHTPLYVYKCVKCSARYHFHMMQHRNSQPEHKEGEMECQISELMNSLES